MRPIAIAVLAIVAAVAVYCVLLPLDPPEVAPLPAVECVRLPKRIVHFEITAGGRPCVGARITLESAGGALETDREGKASFLVPDCRSSYLVQLPGYYCSWGEVGVYEQYDDECEERVDETASIELAPAPNSRGRVVLPDGEPARRALVRILQDERGTAVERAQVTDDEGRFGISSNPPFVVEAVAEGYGVASLRVSQSSDIVVRLGDGASVTGRVAGTKRPSDAQVFAISTDVFWMVDRTWFERSSFGDADREFCARAAVDANGNFVIRGVPPGETILVAFLPREGEARTTPFEAAGEVRRNIRFKPQAGLLVKLVGSDGEPITDPHMDLTSSREGDWSRAAYSHVEGGHLFLDVPLGRYKLSVAPRGHMRETLELDLARPGLHTYVHRAKAGLALVGRVIDRKGRSVPRVTVSFLVEPEDEDAASRRPMAWKLLGHAETGNDGRFKIRGLPKVRGWVVVGGDSTGYAETKREAVAGESKLGPIVVSRLASLRVRLTPAPKITNVNVEVWLDGSWESPRSEKVGADGTIRLSGLGTGRAGVVKIEVVGYAPSAVRFGELAPEEDRDLGVVELTQGRTLKGVLQMRNGDPVARAKVSLARTMIARWCETNADGRFELRRVGVEPATVFVEADGFVAVAVREGKIDASGELRIVVERGGIVTGRTVDQKGKPLDGLIGHVRLRGPKGDTWIDIDRTGKFRQRVLPGSYDVIVVRRFGERAVRRVTVREGETTEIDVALLPSR